MSVQAGYFKRMSTLSLLYFVQGAPYGFQTSCLPLILRKQGLSHTQLGALKLLFIPWVCKPLYAPIVERTKSDLWWLVMSMLGMCLTCLGSAWLGLLSLPLLSVVLFMLNLASATQDITVDSVAIRILEPNELGTGNTVQVVAYKLGAVMVGGSLLWVGEEWGHPFMWFCFSLLYFVVVMLILSLNLIHTTNNTDRGSSSSTISMINENLSKIFKVEGTLWMVIFLLFYKLCERGEAVFPIYLVDKKIPLQRLALWNGVVRSVASIGGSATGGVLISNMKWKPRRVLMMFASVRIIPMLAKTILVGLWGFDSVDLQDLDRVSLESAFFYISIFSLCLGNFCAGILTTAAFTAMMNLSQGAPESIRSTHYSLLATTEVLGKLSFATVSGLIIDEVGLVCIFGIFSLLAGSTLPLLHYMPDNLKGETRN